MEEMMVVGFEPGVELAQTMIAGDEALPEASTTDPSRILDSKEYEIYKNIPVFVEHTRTLKSGRELHFGREELDLLAKRSNRRIEETGDFAPVVVGHTNPDPNAPDPPKIGWAGPFRLGWLTKDHTKYAVLADFRIEKDKIALLNKYPRRSAELWAEERYEDMYLDPISLLGADTPWSDMGVLYSKADDSRREKIYYSIAPQVPGAYGLPKPVVIKNDDKKEKYSMEEDTNQSRIMSAEQKLIAQTITSAIFDSPEFSFLRRLMKERFDEQEEEKQEEKQEEEKEEEEKEENNEEKDSSDSSDSETDSTDENKSDEDESESDESSEDESSDNSDDDNDENDGSDDEENDEGDEEEEDDYDEDDDDFWAKIYNLKSDDDESDDESEEDDEKKERYQKEDDEIVEFVNNNGEEDVNVSTPEKFADSNVDEDAHGFSELKGRDMEKDKKNGDDAMANNVVEDKKKYDEKGEDCEKDKPTLYEGEEGGGEAYRKRYAKEEEIEGENSPLADDAKEEEEIPYPRRRRYAEDEEEEEKKPYSRRRRYAKEEEDDEEEAPYSRRRYSKDDDEEEEKETPYARRRRYSKDEDEEEEEESYSRRRRYAKDEDDKEEKETPYARRRRYAKEDDDDDEKETPYARRRRYAKEDEEEEEKETPYARRRRYAKEDDDEEFDAFRKRESEKYSRNQTRYSRNEAEDFSDRENTILSMIQSVSDKIDNIEKKYNNIANKVVTNERYSRIHDLRAHFIFDEESEKKRCRYSKMTDSQFNDRCREIANNYRQVPTNINIPTWLVQDAPATEERPGAVQYSKERAADIENRVSALAEEYAAQGISKTSDEIRNEVAEKMRRK